MALLRLNLGQDERKSPVKDSAGRITRLFGEPIAATAPDEARGPAGNDGVAAASDSPAQPEVIAAVAIADRQAPASLSEPDFSGPPADPNPPAPLAATDSEEFDAMAERAVPPAASGPSAEPDFAAAGVTIDAAEPGDLRRPDARAASSQPSMGPAFGYGSVSLGLFPARGLFYSVVAHGIAILAVVLLWPKSVPPIYDPPKQWEMTMIPKDALYLPALGGGDAGGPQRGAASKSQTIPSLSVAALSKLGVSFPGAQAIISNPPNPTNKVQTLLQPELVSPPELTKFLRLPNMVRLAENSPSPQPSAPDAPKADPSIEPPVAQSGPPAPTIPQLRALAPVAIETPKLSLPMAAPPTGSMQATAAPPVAPAPPKPSQARLLPGSSGGDTRTLIALSVMPAQPEASPKIPAAEAHGQFAVVALPNLAVSQLGIGSATDAANPAAGAGTNPKANAHDATGTGAMAMGTGAHPAAGGNGAVAGPGPGATDSGAGRSAAGAAEGGMAIRGAAYGSGLGTGNASGAGRGAGPAPGAFAGMTIQGGEWPGGVPAGIASRPPAKPSEPGSYGLTVVSTGNSGSGLGDFGVFFNEPVFTVYVNMTTPSDTTAPSWTLVYAALHAAEAGGGKVAAPFPSTKKTPIWAADLVDRYRNQLVVIYLVIDESGKVQRAKSMESPSVQLVAPLLAVLNQWEFRPATINGRPIAVRALVGVPVSAPPDQAPAAPQTLSENKP